MLKSRRVWIFTTLDHGSPDLIFGSFIQAVRSTEVGFFASATFYMSSAKMLADDDFFVAAVADTEESRFSASAFDATDHVIPSESLSAQVFEFFALSRSGKAIQSRLFTFQATAALCSARSYFVPVNFFFDSALASTQTKYAATAIFRHADNCEPSRLDADSILRRESPRNRLAGSHEVNLLNRFAIGQARRAFHHSLGPFYFSGNSEHSQSARGAA
ncbi:MAG: hypothetical protein KGL39_32455 [Patescibacteria group bacterium]|nr:hypothetical protein [Patescibacteria group bacterium]